MGDHAVEEADDPLHQINLTAFEYGAR